jgi:two-component system, LytTR family, sensor histidine kinase AlgZ
MIRWKHVFGVVLINTAIAFVPAIMLVTMVQGVTWRQFVINFGYSFVYAQCIGSLAFATIPRIWVASCDIHTVARWSARVAASFAVSILGCMVAGLIFVVLGWSPLGAYWDQFAGSLKVATFLTIVAGSVISMFETMRTRLEQTTLQLRTKELERERALKLATEAQLASLESRIHPHFLFNTLNSISSLIPEHPERAERLLEQMAALLRFSLDASHAGLVPLSREMKIVTDYLEIERARFGDRLRYQLDIAADASDAKIPPLAVQTLVENSVKYAVAPSRGGGDIRIAGVRENGLLQMEISDEGPPFNLESAAAGHGLDNLKGRLVTLFGAQATLTVERRETRNSVRLAVPQTGNGHESIPG